MTSVHMRYAVVVGLALAAAGPPCVWAQDRLESAPKGTVGAGLIGAELGLLVPSLLGAQETWAYLVGPMAGAGVGVAIGAVLIDQPDTDDEIGVSLLAVGTAALVPALVVAVAASAYDPDDDAMAGGLGPRLAAGTEGGPGLLRVASQGAFVAAPAVTITLGQGNRGAAVAVPVVSGAF